ncbi:unnamed protein product [Rotaria sp. Silwood2]|nr:unnamed protein product [Rotaria sp. Silwood2]
MWKSSGTVDPLIELYFESNNQLLAQNDNGFNVETRNCYAAVLSYRLKKKDFFLHSHIIEDEDLARLISKLAAITIYAFIGVATLGTVDADTKSLLAGIGITGFTIDFALKVATNFISGIFLLINKPFI